MAGLSSKGFETKRLNNIIESRVADTKNYFGSFAETGLDSVLGRFIRIDAASEADLWELAELIWASFNPSSAQGIALDRLALLSGLQRQVATRSSVELVIEASRGSLIPSGTLIESSDTGTRWETENEINITTSGLYSAILNVYSVKENYVYQVGINGETFSYTALTTDSASEIVSGLVASINASNSYSALNRGDSEIVIEGDSVFSNLNITYSPTMAFISGKKIVKAYSTDFGEIEQPEDSIHTPLIPIEGFISVTNPFDATPGRLRESDELLRLRFQNSKENRASSSTNALHSRLSGLENVRNVRVVENSSNEVSADGLPPHSFFCLVEGGNNQEIAEAIFSTKPSGIGSYGTTSVDIVDSQGITHTMTFGRPVEVEIFITVEISALETTNVPSDAESSIKDALIEYFAENFTIGTDVVYSRLYTPINRVEGFAVDSLSIGTSASSVSAGNISIGNTQVAVVSRENITIVEV